MAKAKVKSQPIFVAKLRESLSNELQSVGVPGEVTYERIPGTKLYRFQVIAKKFAKLGHVERQDLVWRIANNILNPDQQLRISMILTLTPEEAMGE